MISVAYYTSTNFLDAALETIQCIKNRIKLHVFIEITDYSKRSTIVNVDNIDKFKFIERPECLLGKKEWNNYKKYFSGVESVNFIVFNGKKTISFKTILLGIKYGQFIKKLKIDVFHFDTVTLRAFGFLPYLKNVKMVITIHDAIPHSGENSMKEKLMEFIFYRFSKGFIFYSSFSINQFQKYHKRIHRPCYSISLQPYSFNRLLMNNNISTSNYILFFGRLSFYKGIDLFLDAIPAVLKVNPDLLIYIIGKKVYDFNASHFVFKNYKKNIKLITNYIPSKELIQYIQGSKFTVCPYRDASQSGVLMTSMSLGKMTVATNVGAFREYIQDNFNGLLCEPDSISLADKINEALLRDKFKLLEKNINPNFSTEKAKINAETIMNCYMN